MHYIKRMGFPLLTLLSFTTIAPALAQDVREPTVFDGDFLTVGVGAAVAPSYEGSDDYIFTAMPAVVGRVAGIGITPRPGGLALDFINDPADEKIKLQFGPTARIRFNRNRQIKDSVVQSLGKRDVAVEVGGNIGIGFSGITNPYDSLTFSLDVRQDVADAHDSMIIAPMASFQTPLSKGSYVAVNVSAEHVENGYADYYYSISPAQSARSGLSTYDSHGGWKSGSVGVLGALDLDGNLANGGLAIVAGASYSRILGNFKRSPVVADRGSPNQFTGVVGVAFTF